MAALQRLFIMGWALVAQQGWPAVVAIAAGILVALVTNNELIGLIAGVLTLVGAKIVMAPSIAATPTDQYRTVPAPVMSALPAKQEAYVSDALSAVGHDESSSRGLGEAAMPGGENADSSRPSFPEAAGGDVSRRPCPVCGESIAVAAVLCRFCRTDLAEMPASFDSRSTPT